MNKGILIDSYKIIKQPPYGPVGTYQGFKIQTRPESRIDYIFVSKDEVNKFGVLTDMNHNRFPSDHFPCSGKCVVVIELLDLMAGKVIDCLPGQCSKVIELSWYERLK